MSQITTTHRTLPCLAFVDMRRRRTSVAVLIFLHFCCYRRNEHMSRGVVSAFGMLVRPHSQRLTVAATRSINHQWARTTSSRRLVSMSRKQAAESSLFDSNDANKDNSVLHLLVRTAQDMEDVGALLATTWLDDDDEPAIITTESHCFIPTCLLLQGDLGAGKTAFARGFVQGAVGDDTVRVTSPTYLLSNTYQLLGTNNNNKAVVEIHHMDLYRLTGDKDSNQFAPLNLEHVFCNCISLIEWPSRLWQNASNDIRLPEHRVTVDIRILSSNNRSGASSSSSAREENDIDTETRRVTLTVHGACWRHCLNRIRQEGSLDDMIIRKNGKGM